jgi:hypothetical protein
LLGRALDGLLALDYAGLAEAELVALLPVLQTQVRRLPLAVAGLDAELVARNVAETLGFRDPRQLLADALAITPAQARRRLDTAARYTARTTFTGQRLAPRFPATAASLREGGLSLEHADVIADAIDSLPAEIRATDHDRVETSLVAHAATTDPARLRQLAARVLAHLDPDGPTPAQDHRHRAARELSLFRTPDSSGLLTATLTPACQAIWETILTPLAQPRDADPLGPDTRTPSQRMHDAFEEAGRRLLAAGDLPQHAGLPTTLLISRSLTDLQRRAGAATTHHGGTLSITEALRLATDAQVMPVICDDAGAVLAYGRTRRLASPGQRRALFTRDRGCSFPHCPRTAAQSQIHHLTDWANGGPTNLDNLTITCGYHNNEAPRQHWQATMINGIPHWKPPPWHPNQQPQRNYHHHPELITTE